MFDFGGSNAKGESAKGAVCAGVAVSTDDGESWLSEAKLRTYDMHNALQRRRDVEVLDAVFAGIFRKCLTLKACFFVSNVLLHRGA